MRGLATIDRQPDGDAIAVWITSRGQAGAAHGNAVVVDVSSDPDALEKVRSLTRCCAVLVTDGSTLDGLPVEGTPLCAADLELLVSETVERQEAIVEAVNEYKRRTRSKTLTLPTFAAPARAEDFPPRDGTASSRAFALANFAQSAWTTWLQTDEERRRRTIQPKTGLTPWVMPEELNEAQVPDFPERFAARIHEQPLV